LKYFFQFDIGLNLPFSENDPFQIVKNDKYQNGNIFSINQKFSYMWKNISTIFQKNNFFQFDIELFEIIF
jgi:hypothetical protein